MILIVLISKLTDSYSINTAAAHEQMAMIHQQQQQMRAEMQRRHIQQQVIKSKQRAQPHCIRVITDFDFVFPCRREKESTGNAKENGRE